MIHKSFCDNDYVFTGPGVRCRTGISWAQRRSKIQYSVQATNIRKLLGMRGSSIKLALGLLFLYVQYSRLSNCFCHVHVHRLGFLPQLWPLSFWTIHFSVPHLNLITFYQLLHFCLAEEHKLLVLNHLREMFLGEQLGSLHQVQAIVSFGKVSDTQTVGRIKLTLQEITARSFHPWGNERYAFQWETHKLKLQVFFGFTVHCWQGEPGF